MADLRPLRYNGQPEVPPMAEERINSDPKMRRGWRVWLLAGALIGLVIGSMKPAPETVIRFSLDAFSIICMVAALALAARIVLFIVMMFFR